jgi:hypothetical protein
VFESVAGYVVPSYVTVAVTSPAEAPVLETHINWSIFEPNGIEYMVILAPLSVHAPGVATATLAV